MELAWGAAIGAEWAHFVALGVFAYERGGAAAVGVAGLVRLLPAAAVAPFAASLGDRFRRERFLLAMTLVGSGALAASAAAAFAAEPVLVFVFAAVVGISSTLIRPALQALLPSLARTPEELIAANAATSTVESVGTLAGPLLAGVLVSFADVGVVFIGSAGMLLAATALLARVRVEGRISLAAAEDQTARRLIGGGFEAIALAPRARLLVGLGVAQCFVRGCLNVLIVVAVFDVLHGNGAQVGYLTAAIGVGGLLGALGAMTLGARRLALPFGLALVFWGLPITLIAPRPYFAAAAFLLAIVGAANSVEDVALFTLLQRSVPDDTLTRVLGIFWGLAMGGVAIGSIAAPVIVKAVGPRPAFVVVGSILPLLTLMTYRRLVEIDRTTAPAPELDLINRVPMFAPLSIAMKERVAANLVPVRSRPTSSSSAPAMPETASTSSAPASSTSTQAACTPPHTTETTSAKSHSCATCRGQRPSRRPSTPSCTPCNVTRSSPRSPDTPRPTPPERRSLTHALHEPAKHATPEPRLSPRRLRMTGGAGGNPNVSSPSCCPVRCTRTRRHNAILEFRLRMAAAWLAKDQPNERSTP